MELKNLIVKIGLVIVNKEKRIFQMVDVVVVAEYNAKRKEIKIYRN